MTQAVRMYFGSESNPVSRDRLLSGFFRLRVNGNDVAYDFPHNVEANTIQPFMPAGVTVSATLDGFLFDVTDGSDLTLEFIPDQYQPLRIAAGDVLVDVQQSGQAAVAEQQTVDLTAAKVYLTNPGGSTAPILTLDDVGIQAACDQILGGGVATVSNGVITRASPGDQPALTISGGNGATIAVTQQGSAGRQDITRIILPAANEGGFHLTRDGQASVYVDFGESASGVEYKIDQTGYPCIVAAEGSPIQAYVISSVDSNQSPGPVSPPNWAVQSNSFMRQIAAEFVTM